MPLARQRQSKLARKMATREIRQRVYAEARLGPSGIQHVEMQLRGLAQRRGDGVTVQELSDAVDLYNMQRDGKPADRPTAL